MHYATYILETDFLVYNVTELCCLHQLLFKVRDYKIDFKEGFTNLPREEYPELYNTYSTYLYTDRVNTILDEYAAGNNANPFYMYLATQSIHDPLEVPKEYEDLYPHSEIDSQLRTVSFQNLKDTGGLLC